MRLETASANSAHSFDRYSDWAPTPLHHPAPALVGDGVEGAKSVLSSLGAPKDLSDAVKKVFDRISRNTDQPYTDKGVAFLTDERNVDGNAISPNDVHQGSVGDCALMATMANIAERNPQAIRNMIGNEKYDANGKLQSCTVRIYTPVKLPWIGEIQVPHDELVDCTKFPQKRAGIGDQNGDKVEMWPMILEKAYAQTHPDYYAGLNDGVATRNAMAAFTGQGASDFPTSNYSFASLSNDVASKKLVSFATLATQDQKGNVIPGQEALDAKLKANGLKSNHAYAIQQTWSGADGSQWVKLYNPWGEKDTQAGPDAFRDNNGGWMRFEDVQKLLPNATVGAVIG
jgi:hypothetical protein